jgi:hypothetical protein
MNGLKQIAVVTQGNGWHVVGLDDQGRIWFGTTRRTTKGRAITWALMDESAEDQGPQPTSAPPPRGRNWAAIMVLKADHLKIVGWRAFTVVLPW